MPVLPDFQPENQSYGRTAAFGQSMMERSQAMRLREDRAQQERVEFQAKLPLIQATATSAVVSAKAAVDNATRLEQFRSQAAVASKTYNDEYLAIMQDNSAYDVEASDGTPEGDAAQKEQAQFATQETLNNRANRLAALRAKISWMDIIPENKGFVDTVTKSASEAAIASLGNAKQTELLAAANARVEAMKYAADQRRASVEATALARTGAAQIYTGSRERIKELDSDTKLTLQDRGAKIAAEKQGATIQNLLAHAAEADQAAADASAAGDEQAAAVHRQAATNYRDAVQKNSTFAGQAPGEVPKKSPDPRPHAKPVESGPSPEISVSIPGSEVDGADKGATEPVVAPTKVSKDAKTVEIGGKTYPIFKDKNGKRAYKVDGHFVPIDTE